MRDALLAGFPPLVRPDARVLVLGTMPSTASLAAAQYYAHPRNAFWRIMGTIVGCAPDAEYPERVAALTAAGVAVWDVLGACHRRGSLDTAIEPETMVVNDFPAFFEAQPGLRLVACNGGKAAELFRRHAEPMLAGRDLPPRVQLPSTSPTNARLRLADKLGAWQAALLPAIERR
jgi:hypoxanthine-DNA glycosylase